METQQHKLFRKEALEHLSSPERLDQIMQVISPKKWLPLAALGSLVAAGVIWSVVGRIPITVMGQGVLVYPSKVMNFESSSSGQLLALNVRVGDVVKKGEVLATISQPDLQKQLQQQRDKLSELQLQSQTANMFQSQRTVVATMEIESQRQNFQQRLQEARALVPTLRERLRRRRGLQTEGAISEDTVLEAKQAYLDGLKKVSDFEDQLKELNIKEKSQAEQNFESATNRQNQILEVRQTIGQLELQLRENSQIISKQDGRILEIAATPGQILSPGVRLGSIAAQEQSGQLVGVTFFSNGDGKKIQKGMKVEITPATVKRERFGGMISTVTSVSAFPVTKDGASSILGNSELAQSLMPKEPQIEVFSALKPDISTFSGYQWSSSKGPSLQVTPGTITAVRVTVEERAPITFVFPILRAWSGID